MAAFAYQALDQRGRNRKGILEGDNARHIRQQLRADGLTPLAVEAVIGGKAVAGQRSTARSGFKGRVSTAELAITTRQLATLISSGLVLEETLRAVAQQTEKQGMKSVLLSVRSRVMEGHSLAAALADFPSVFPDIYRATVAAGEQSGHLHTVLERLAEYTESRQVLSQKIMLALFYPVILSTVAILVVVGLLAYVVPQVVQVFEGIGQQLPLLTRVLIGISDFLVDYGPLLLVVIVIGGIVFKMAMRAEGPRAAFHRLLLSTPLISRLIVGVNSARFCRTLAIALGSSVPILDALDIAEQVMTNIPMRRSVKKAAIKVREGASLHEALAEDGLFTPITIHLIASGEQSGNLEGMLDRAAINQERELEAIIATFLGLFEPLLILLMGGVVLTIVIAILLPVFELNELVK